MDLSSYMLHIDFSEAHFPDRKGTLNTKQIATLDVYMLSSNIRKIFQNPTFFNIKSLFQQSQVHDNG
jgi:hypothetical protein